MQNLRIKKERDHSGNSSAKLNFLINELNAISIFYKLLILL